MRPTLYADVACAARALLLVSARDRATVCRKMLCEAEIADKFRALHGRVHPRLGNGSLMAVARLRPMSPEPFFDNPEYCACFELVLTQVRRYWLRKPRS